MFESSSVHLNLAMVTVRPVLLLSLLAGQALGFRILAVLPFSIYSHINPFLPILDSLVEKGHHLTLLSNFTLPRSSTSFTQIPLEMDAKQFIAEIESIMGEVLDAKDFNGLLYHATGMMQMCPIISAVLAAKVKPLLPNPASEKFDLIIIEAFFCQEFLLGLSHYYNAPLAATLAGPLSPFIAEATGNPQLFSYIPNIRLPLTDHMNIFERAWNTLINLFELISHRIFYFPKQDKLMRELLEDSKDLPYISNLFHNISLILTEAHFSMNYPRPYLRNVVEVGITSFKIDKIIPKDLQDFMDDSENGIIYFSWGSHYDDKDPEEKLKALMDTFSKLKQRVIFKWANETIPNKPDNVRVVKWAPQLNVLAHKKTKVFISHCGLNSVYEAAYFGVPVIGTPLFGDQPHNSRLLESFGMSITVNPNDITDQVSLGNAINKILSDNSFRLRAEERSRMMRDRPIPAVAEATYWLEYVMNHNGGKHMRPASVHIPWYSLLLLDVWLVLATLLILPVAAITLMIRYYMSFNRLKVKKIQ